MSAKAPKQQAINCANGQTLGKDRKNAGITAIPDGLYLNKVYYGGENIEG